VGLYTRQSLYVLLWLFVGSIVVASVGDLDGGDAAVLVAGGVAVTGAAFAALLHMLPRYPAVTVPRERLAALCVAGVAYLAVAWPTLDVEGRGAAVSIVVAGFTVVLALLPSLRISYGVVLAAGLLALASGGHVINFAAGALVSAFIVFTVRASVWMLGIVQELDEAARVKAELAVVEERLRFSRDVHDVLGRRLSTIAVQAELAATLAERGDERAAERMLEVRGVAHEALREARELARGYRSTDFLNELEGARSLLRSAGIEVVLSVDAVPRGWHEAAAWVVRESVTNVLRHSSARTVQITWADGCLQVANDGVGAMAGRDDGAGAARVDGASDGSGLRPAPVDGAGDGSGLRGLGERLAPLGASLRHAGPEGADGWRVVAELPGSGPLSATSLERAPA
jgi:two-component system, NarL family, sensor histidine kinase DesK